MAHTLTATHGPLGLTEPLCPVRQRYLIGALCPTEPLCPMKPLCPTRQNHCASVTHCAPRTHSTPDRSHFALKAPLPLEPMCTSTTEPLRSKESLCSFDSCGHCALLGHCAQRSIGATAPHCSTWVPLAPMRPLGFIIMDPLNSMEPLNPMEPCRPIESRDALDPACLH